MRHREGTPDDFLGALGSLFGGIFVRLLFHGSGLRLTATRVGVLRVVMAKRTKLLPQNHLAAIGAVAVHWTAIENLMEHTILALYEIDLGRGLVLTSNLSFHSRLSLLRILAAKESGMMSDALCEETSKLLNRIDDAYSERNFIIHGSWFPNDKSGMVRRMSVRARGKKLVAESKLYNAAELWAVADRIGDLIGDFFALGERLGVKARLANAPKHSTASE